MSGFTRDTYHYGDKLVYEALERKWSRYHDMRCDCGKNWYTAHAEPAGFIAVRTGSGFIALTGPGLTEGVDESALTTNALWQAVTGTPGEGWIEEVHVVDRSPAARAQYKAEREAQYAQKRERAARSKIELASVKQIDYLRALIAKTDPDRLDAEFANAIAGTAIAPRAEDESTEQAIQRLTRAAARKLISSLVGNT
ncbi:hypothetical protein [Nocardia sp. NPDC004260]